MTITGPHRNCTVCLLTIYVHVVVKSIFNTKFYNKHQKYNQEKV